MRDEQEQKSGDRDAGLLLIKDMGMDLNPPKRDAESDMQKN